MRMHLNAIHEIEEFLFFSGVIIDFVQFWRMMNLHHLMIELK